MDSQAIQHLRALLRSIDSAPWRDAAGVRLGDSVPAYERARAFLEAHDAANPPPWEDQTQQAIRMVLVALPHGSDVELVEEDEGRCLRAIPPDFLACTPGIHAVSVPLVDLEEATAQRIAATVLAKVRDHWNLEEGLDAPAPGPVPVVTAQKPDTDAVARLESIEAAFRALVASPYFDIGIAKVSEGGLWDRLCEAIGIQAPMPRYARHVIAARLLAKRYWQFCAAESAEEMATTFDRLEAALGDYCAAQRLIPEQNTRDLTLDD